MWGHKKQTKKQNKQTKKTPYEQPNPSAQYSLFLIVSWIVSLKLRLAAEALWVRKMEVWAGTDRWDEQGGCCPSAQHAPGRFDPHRVPNKPQPGPVTAMLMSPTEKATWRDDEVWQSCFYFWYSTPHCWLQLTLHSSVTASSSKEDVINVVRTGISSYSIFRNITGSL